MTKEKAIQYLVDNSVYGDEWSGAGMWHAVVSVMTSKPDITEERLQKLLQEAKDN